MIEPQTFIGYLVPVNSSLIFLVRLKLATLEFELHRIRQFGVKYGDNLDLSLFPQGQVYLRCTGIEVKLTPPGTYFVYEYHDLQFGTWEEIDIPEGDYNPWP